MTEKMTVHKALSELKTLDARIEKAETATRFVFANKRSNNVVNGVPIAAYCESIKSSYQSAVDLLARRTALKRALVLSNASTRITVGGKEYTVAEAIEAKNNEIPRLKNLLQRLEIANVDAQRTAQVNNNALDERADNYVKSLYSDADMKNLSDEMKKVREDFIKAQTAEVVDPLDITARMKELEERINAFTVDVDAALSVSNALTEIEISY